jgi:outer membrane receptor protein involved in Fe transport
MRPVFLLLALLLVAPEAFAQVGTVRGQVRESGGTPAAFATVKLLHAADSSLRQGTVADAAGTFRLPSVAPGTYRVQASVVGQVPVWSAAFGVSENEVMVPPLMLGEATQTLAAVTVRSQRQLVEREVDKTVLNVAADATATGKTAFEVLQAAPGVFIDPTNETIQMAGKTGANVLIDGRPTNLSARELANLLRGTPAADLEKVELIPNPSARFDASGNAGIINLRFKRNPAFGLNGSLAGGWSQSRHVRKNANGNLNFRRKSVNLFGTFGYNGNYQDTRVQLSRTVGNQRFEQNGFDRDGFNTYTNFKAGADWFLNARSTLGVLLTGNSSRARFGSDTRTDIRDATTNRLDSSVVNQNRKPITDDRLNLNLNYRFADTLGTELTLDADATRFNSASLSTLTNEFRSATEVPYRLDRTRFDARTDIQILSVRADFRKELRGLKAKLETGLKTNLVTTDNALGVSGFLENQFQNDPRRSNDFRYREAVQAGYATLSKRFGKLSTQIGLRAERTDLRGESRQGTFTRGYLSGFPSAFAQLQLTENKQLNFSAGRRIQRPNYQDMNPFVYQLDPYASERGNPNLRPQFTKNVEIGYTYRYATSLTLGYSRINDFYTEITRLEGVIGYAQPENVGTVDQWNLSLNTPFQPAKGWNGYLYLGANHRRYRANLPDGTLDDAAFGGSAYLQNSFTLPRSYTLQVSGFFSAPTRETIFRNCGLGSLNLALKKPVFAKKGTLTLGVDDLLNTMRWRQVVDFGPQQIQIDRKWESRRVRLQVSYAFGSQKIKAARERESNTEAGRIKMKSGE